MVQWGPAALRRLVGMFAFAMFDRQARTVLLARDFFGIKPLYYVQNANQFAFASEIKALLALPNLSRRVNPARLYCYLTACLTDHRSDTLLEEVHQLLPGHYLTIPLGRPGRGELQTYWRLEPEIRTDISFDEAARQLREMFLESVRIHMRSDVAVGSALSGGIDSSAIAGAIREVCGRQVEYHTFTFVAPDSPVNEEHWGDMVAASAGTVPHKVRIRPQELVEDLDRLIEVQDEPFGSTSLYAQYRVFRLAQENGVKVLLDGQGGDELFGGYTGYLYPRLTDILRTTGVLPALRFARSAATRPGIRAHRLLGRASLALLPAWLRRSAEASLARVRGRQWLNLAWFREHGVVPTEVTSEAFRAGLRPALVEAATQSNLPRLLRYEDRNSMAFSVESRVPFLTPAIAQFTLGLPSEYLIADDGTSKAVFREAMRGIVPEPILTRRDKIGFETPERNWLQVLQPWVKQVLSSDSARQLPVLRHRPMMAQIEAIYAGRRRFDWRLWRWLNLIRWSELLGIQY
jgi:asparagine synthase (glutamine-hydrolysing)